MVFIVKNHFDGGMYALNEKFMRIRALLICLFCFLIFSRLVVRPSSKQGKNRQNYAAQNIPKYAHQKIGYGMGREIQQE